MAKAAGKHYIDNKKFYTAIIQYKRDVEEAASIGKDPPRIPRYIGECLYKIATRLSLRPNFINYPFREEMISDGLENCINYLSNFNPEKSDNPFAYFTQIIWFAFLRRIDKEKKHLYIKQKTLENFYFQGMLADQSFDEDRSVNVNLDNDYMKTLVETFDKKQVEKQRKTKEKKQEQIDLDNTEFDDEIPV
ncbi:RNA polymerase sigma factor [uncultured Caudovirales phage]|uniref:RNA polymerase sigma-like factor n=1 Tax=uncultured Caudovirales phage TaxID=2100421 RepID=A0A6J7WSU8_9CAUD|nr:RNA polymerase sigma factor [uncultured Caudovirales phage]